MSLAYIGVKGGMVVLVADDPGPISSQTEQDTRHFGQFSKLPVFDPLARGGLRHDRRGVRPFGKKWARRCFRPTTRVCHACAVIDVEEARRKRTAGHFEKDQVGHLPPPVLPEPGARAIESRNPRVGTFPPTRFNAAETYGAGGGRRSA